MIDQSVTTPKRHFKALDGLRGVAALVVVNFHFIEMAAYGDSKLLKLIISHGFLAVDFFFCLSGFVIGYAYDDRLRTMSFWAFLKARLIRLQPLVVLGSVLGLIGLLIDPFSIGPLGYSAAKVALLFLASIFMIPCPVMPDRAFNLFGLNAPSWSLFWEYVASIVYAAFIYRFNRFWLIAATAFAAIGVCVVGHSAGNLVGGWNGATFWHGGARAAYSFLAGLLVYRSKWMIRTRLGFTAMSLLLLLALGLPYVDGDWMREAAVIIFYFPLLIALGAGATLSPHSAKICTFFGNMSYPLYMTHYFVMWSFGNYYGTYKPDLSHLLRLTTSGVLTMVVVAYLAMVLYDIPIRRFLRTTA